MAQSNGTPGHTGQFFGDSLLNDGIVTSSPWFNFANDIAPDPGIGSVPPIFQLPTNSPAPGPHENSAGHTAPTPPPVPSTGSNVPQLGGSFSNFTSTVPSTFQPSTNFAGTAPGQWSNSGGTHSPGSTTPGSTTLGSITSDSLSLNTGLVVSNTTSDSAPGSVPITTSQSVFSGGSATAASASDLNALITAADSMAVNSGTFTIDISGSISLNTLPAVPTGETLTISGGKGTLTEGTSAPDIAAVNLHSGVSLVINGSNNAILDGVNTVRGLFAYAGNLTVNNLTIQNTVAQGGAGASAGFAGGGGAGLGGGLFVASHATVTLNSVSFSGNKAIGGAGGNNLGGATAAWGGGGGLGGAGGMVFGSYFGGGGGVGRTAFGGDGSYKAVTTYGKTDDSSLPGPGIIVGGASGGHGAPLAYSVGGSPAANNPHTPGAVNGGGGGIGEAVNPSGPPYFGAAGGGGGVGGHAGYSYATGYDSKEIKGGGGDGGFGGGGGAGYYYGGAGGFGGGGGGGQYKYGGNGGFGGGGGGLPNTAKTLAQGGFGGGNAGGGPNIGNGKTPQYADSGGAAGGGGLGAGGAVFVQSGGFLSLGGAGTVGAGTVTPGAGGIVSETDNNGAGTAGTAGGAFGSGIFIQNNSTLAAQGVTLAPGSGQTLTVSGVIADEEGSGGSGVNASKGALVIAGGGDVKLTASNTFEGGSSISANSTLDVGGTHAAGSGAISFGSGNNVLILEAAAEPNGTTFSNSVSAFAATDVIDLSGLTFHAGTATAHIVSNNLTVTSGTTTDIIPVPGAATFTMVVAQDAGTGTVVESLETSFTITNEAQLLTDLSLINNGGADAEISTAYTFDFLNSVAIVTGGETLNLLTGSSVDYTGTGFTTGGTMTVTAGTLVAEATGAIGSGAYSIASGGTVSLNGFNQSIGDLTGAGSISLGSNTLTLGTGNSTSFSGVISGGGAVIKQGAGTLTLSGANTYSGGLSLNAGQINLGATNALEGATGALTVASGATLNLNGSSQTIGDLTGAGAIDPVLPSTLTVGTSNSTNFTGVISGAVAVVKQGTGTLTLSGANSYTQGLTINAGMIKLGASGAAEGSAGTVAVASGATLNLNGFNQTVGDLSGAGAVALPGTLTEGTALSTSFTGVISGAGELIKQGTGTLTLSGANSYTGGLSITAGQINVGAAGAAEASTGALSVGGSGNFNLNGFNQTVGDLSGSGSIFLSSNTLTVGTTNSTSFTGAFFGTSTGTLIKQGTGTLSLALTDSLPGPLTINAGGVLLGNAGAADGSGTITFGSGTGDVLEFHANTVPTNTIAGFVPGQTFDVNMTGTTVTGASIVNTHTLQITLSSGGPLDLTLSPLQTWTGVNFGHTTSGSDNFITDLGAAATIVAGASATFNGGGAAVVADSGLSITDPSSTTLVSAAVSIASGFESTDTLTIATPGTLAHSYSNGTLTLTGTASLATYQTALESIKFGTNPTNADPTGGGSDTSRTIDWVVNDGIQNSGTATSTINTVHTAPTVTAGGTATFDGGGGAVALDPGLTATDVDSGGVLSTGTVTIVSPINGDTLNFTNGHPSTEGNIAVSSDTGGVLVLSSSGSTATVLQWETALESVQYVFTPSDGDPTNGGGDTSRTIDWSVNDGVANSATSTSTLDTVHSAPTLIAGATASYTGGGSPAVLDASPTVIDIDSNGDLVGATLKISSGEQSSDALNFTNQNGITGSFNSGTLSLSGTATIAQYETALASVTYSSSSGDPTSGGTDDSRTISWTVNDGAALSNVPTSTVDVTAGSLGTPSITGITPDTGISSTDGITDTGALTVDGTGPDNATIDVFNGSTLIATGSAGGGGSWTATLGTALAPGNYTLTAKAILSGVTSAASPGFAVDVDETAPAVTESLVSDSGSSGSDNITNNDAVTGGGDANAVVTITEGATTLGTTVANGGGTWLFSAYSPALSQGSNTIVASETDTAGNTGSASVTFTLDTVAPAVTESLVSDSGSSGSDNITNNDAVTGGGDANAVVTITEGATTLGTTVANGGGTWLFSAYSPALSQGSNTIVASETDTAGNTGSASVTFTLDTVAPAVTESLVSDTGSSGSDKITSNDAVTGGGDPNAVVTIKEGVTTLGTTTANGAGTWTFSAYSPALSQGSNTIVASETDTAGNAGSATVTFTLDTVAPVVSSIDTVGPSSNTGGTEQFAVTFSESVTGVDTSDFALADTGSVSGTINSISGSGGSYTVTVTGATGTGTMGLDLNNSGTSIQDIAGNAISGGFTSGQTYSIAPATGAPSISAPSTATVGVGQAGSLGTITIAESPITGGETFTLVVSDNAGTLAANTGAIGGGGTITPSNANMTLTISNASLTQVNADLTTLTDTEPTTASDTVSYSLTDSNGGSASPASTTVTVNGLPTISAPGSASLTQNVAASPGTITIGETGNTTTSGETFTVVVSDGAGILSANTSVLHGGGLITPSGGGTTLTIGGTLLQVNADLTTLTDDDASTASDTITVHATDSFGNSDATDGSIPVTVTAGTVTFDALVYLDTNGDGSQDGGETGLPGVTVNLLDGSGNPTGQSLTTDASGDVSFTTLAPGSYEIGVVAPSGDAVSQATNVNTPNTLSTGQTASATEGVYAPATFSVHVYDDVNANGSQGTGDTNAAGVTVNLLDGSGSPTGRSTTTDASGNASFTGLAPGSYEIGVVTPAGDVVSQSVNLNTSNNLSSGGSASATEGFYGPPALSQPTISLTDAEGQSLGNLWSTLIANGVDPVPASLSIVSIGTVGTQGYVSLNSGSDSLTYLATGLNPSEPVDAFTYTLKDGSGGTVTGTVDVTITGPNLPTIVVTATGGTGTSPGAGERLIAEGTGETLIGSTAGGDEFFGGPDTTISAFGAGNTIHAEPGNHSIAMGTNNNTLTLGDGNNTISATGTGNTVTAGNGNNHVSGMTGNATITLGNGNDSVSVSGANNNITVGTGTDTISAGNGGNETVTAGNGTNTISGGGSGDSFTGGNGANKITATGANASIVAGNGGNTILGTGTGDQITTGTGNDSIQVTAGSATIRAGLGTNTIKFAGSGNVVINQGGTDTLTDTGTNNTIALPLAGQGLDTINGSVLANGDTFDLRAALGATTWDHQISDVGDYLSMGTSGSNALVQLSVTIGGTPITIAVLNGQGSVSLSSFVIHSLLT